MGITEITRNIYSKAVLLPMDNELTTTLRIEGVKCLDKQGYVGGETVILNHRFRHIDFVKFDLVHCSADIPRGWWAPLLD